MKTLRFILGDQLSRSVSSLADLNPARDVVLMVEVMEEATYVRHHKQKIAFLFSAMRHFADALAHEGIVVDYVKLGDPGNSGTFGGELQRAVSRHRPDRIVATEPGEWRVLQAMRRWRGETGIPVELRDDTRFFANRADFRRWAEGRQTYRMEFFYRDMRRANGILMDGNRPEGGEWNFDRENRKPLPRDLEVPARRALEPDAITREVLNLVSQRFAGHFGDLETFSWAVTREEALVVLDDFIEYGLPTFGDYQDAMKSSEPFLFHSMLSPYLNAGLLLAREVVARAEQAYRAGDVPLNSAEGFIRQILGWREYIRGLYWLKMPDYAQTNFFNAKRPLPAFYWTGETRSNCLHHCISATKRHAYEHHIQRLMITGNFALIAGVDPAQVEEWYLVVFADAYEWVELPNTHGMILFADGGLLGSKPYAASGAYINKMSDYCRGCTYDVRQRTGPDACPFNYLYWDFLIRNRHLLEANPRLSMPYRTIAKMPDRRVAEIKADAARYLDSLEPAGAGHY